MRGHGAEHEERGAGDFARVLRMDQEMLRCVGIAGQRGLTVMRERVDERMRSCSSSSYRVTVEPVTVSTAKRAG